MQQLKVHKLKNIQLKKEIVCLYIKLTTPHLYNYFLNHLKNHKTSSEYNILDKQGRGAILMFTKTIIFPIFTYEAQNCN